MLRAAGIREITVLDSVDVFTAALKHFSFDIVLINDLGGLDLDYVAGVLRDEVVTKNPFSAAIVFSSKITRTTVRRVISIGFDELLSIPFSAEDLFGRINNFSNVDRKFIRVGGYFGPERRRFFEGAPVGTPERRTAKGQAGDSIMRLSPETRHALARQKAEAAAVDADPMAQMDGAAGEISDPDLKSA